MRIGKLTRYEGSGRGRDTLTHSRNVPTHEENVQINQGEARVQSDSSSKGTAGRVQNSFLRCCCHTASGRSSSSLDCLAGTACALITFFTFPFIGAMGCEGVAVADSDRPGDRPPPPPCCPYACLSAAYLFACGGDRGLREPGEDGEDGGDPCRGGGDVGEWFICMPCCCATHPCSTATGGMAPGGSCGAPVATSGYCWGATCDGSLIS